MKPAGLWLGCLAMAGSCLLGVAGCGSDVPDPSSDSAAAVDAPTRIVDGGGEGPAPPPASTPAETPRQPEPAPTPVAATPNPAPAAEPAPTPPPVVAAATEPATETPKPAATADAGATPGADGTPAAKNDSSATEEMLRMAAVSTPPTAGAPAATPGATPATPAAGAASDPSAAAGIPGMPGNKGRGAAMAEARGGPAGPEGAAAARPGPGGAPEGMTARGGPGGSSGAGAAAVNLPPANYRDPGSATMSFLDALKAKNKDRLSQATARRAATEAVEKHRKIFAAILEQSISDEELDDMAKSLDNYQVQTLLPAKSTGLWPVVIGRSDNRDRLQRTVQVRHEKEGWKVMDIGDAIDFKPIGTMRNPNAPGRRR